jgi:hypothetical protein
MPPTVVSTGGADVAGESAREVARRAREKAERLNRRAELFEQGAAGETATAQILASMPPGWHALHDRRWPGRRLANVDHVLVGPGGIFVIDSKNWTGKVTTKDGVLRQNGYDREKSVAGAADAALAVAELIAPYAPCVYPVICFTGHRDISGWCHDVMVCDTANVTTMLLSRPSVFTPVHVSDAYWRLDSVLRSASGPGATPVESPGAPAVGRARKATATSRTRSAAQARSLGRSRKNGLSLGRFVVGIAMLFALITAGPQLASGVSALVTDLLTKSLGRSTCAEPAPAQPEGAADKKAKAAKRSEEKNRQPDAVAANEAPCE